MARILCRRRYVPRGEKRGVEVKQVGAKVYVGPAPRSMTPAQRTFVRGLAPATRQRLYKLVSDDQMAIEEAVRSVMEVLRRELVNRIRSGTMPGWKPESSQTQKAKGFSKPLVRTGRLVRQLQRWPIDVQSEDEGGTIKVTAGFMPAEGPQEDPWTDRPFDDSLRLAIPTDMFLGWAGAPGHSGRGRAPIPERPVTNLAQEFSRQMEQSLNPWSNQALEVL